MKIFNYFSHKDCARELKELRKDLEFLNNKIEDNHKIIEEKYRQNILALKENKEVSSHYTFALPKRVIQG